MFDLLKDNFSKVFSKIKKKGIISEKDVEEIAREIRIALLEADVALPVVKKFVAEIKEKASGKEVLNSITPEQMVIKIVNDAIVNILDDQNKEISFKASPPAIFLLLGLQGVGKTTTSAKLAAHIRKKHKKKVLLASLDVYRPAAQDQLEILGKEISIDTLEIIKNQPPLEITARAIDVGKKQGYDVIILDSAGRLHTNEDLVNEVKEIKNFCKPVETYLAVDAMTGQDAVNSAREFNEKVGITGIVLTRVDADARGGAALSVKYITEKPIKFIGTGEKISDFQPFHPDRIASKILGMGDVVSLVEKAMENIDEAEAQKMVKKATSGSFDMEDLRKQLKNLKKMGGFSSLIGMLPGMKNKFDLSKVDPKMVVKQEAIIDSMNKRERKDPRVLNASRKLRIAHGSGTSVQDINKLLKQFSEMQKLMKKMKGLDKIDTTKIPMAKDIFNKIGG